MLARYNDLNKKKENCRLNSSNKDFVRADENESNDSIGSTSNDSCENVQVPGCSKKFYINISAMNWQRITPVEKVYHRVADNEHRKLDRSYNILPPGVWTYVLSRAIARERKDVPCRWTFKRGKVYDDGVKYIIVAAKCGTCNAILNGYLKNKPESPNKIIRFEFEALQIDYLLHEQNKHQKNLRIGGEASRSLCAEQGPATRVRRNLLTATEMFEPPIERVPSANAIRCSRYRLRKQEELDDCPMKALQMLKQSFFSKWIRAIGLDPFFCTYSNTDQVILYKVYKRKNKLTTLSCDATGNVVRKIGMFVQFILSMHCKLNVLVTSFQNL